MGAVALLALLVMFAVVIADGSPFGGWAGLVLTSGGALCLYRRPRTALALFTFSPLAVALLGYEPTGFWSIGCFAALVLALHGLPGWLVGAVIGAANFLAIAIFTGTVDVQVDASASIGAFAAFVAAGTGSAIRSHQQYLTEVERNAREALAAQAESIRRSVAEERVRMARDLHDSVGHRIAVLSMNIGSAQIHLGTDLAAAESDLDQARASVQAVLRETQQILRVLRLGDSTDATAPTPTHDRIQNLVESFRAAGLRVDATLTDLDRPVAQRTSVAAYRVTQEALTNAQKYGAGDVSVRVSVQEDSAVTIDVVNAIAPGTSRVSGGNGLAGMRERVASVGGELETHSRNGMYWVTATLPADPADSRDRHGEAT